MTTLKCDSIVSAFVGDDASGDRYSSVLADFRQF